LIGANVENLEIRDIRVHFEHLNWSKLLWLDLLNSAFNRAYYGHGLMGKSQW